TMALCMPVMMLLLYGYALSLDVDHVPIYVYDQNHTSASRDLAREFSGSRYFDVLGFVDNYPAIERAIDSNRILMALVIPNDYGKHLNAGREAQVQLLLDGSDANTASIAQGYAETLVR